MPSQNFYCCTLIISRIGKDYGIDQPKLRAATNLYMGNTGMSFSIGSAPEDYIHIRNLAPRHIHCTFSDEKITLEANAPVDFTIFNKQHKIEQGCKIFHLERENWLGSLQCKIVFPNDASVILRMNKEEDQLPSQTLEYLENQYGSVKQIRAGASSLIFKTQDDSVLKILKPALVDNKRVVTRFINASKKFRMLPKSLFSEISEIIYHKEYKACYVTLKYCPGETLNSYMTRKGVLPLEEAQSIVKAIARKLWMLEQYNYASRNLSPSNVLLQEDGEIKLTGFFLLKTDSNLTVEGAKMIIPQYSAPEQNLDPSSVDILADVFSLGSIFYAMLLGETPFAAMKEGDYLRMLQARKDVTEEEISSKSKNIPPEICKLIAGLLSFDKHNRPDPLNLISALHGTKKEEKISASSNNLMANLEFLDEGKDSQSTETDDQKQDFTISREFSLKNMNFIDQQTTWIENQGPRSAEKEPFSNLEFLDEEDEEMRHQSQDIGQKQKRAKTSFVCFKPQSESPSKDEKENVLASTGYCIEIIDSPSIPQKAQYYFSQSSPVTIGKKGDLRIPSDAEMEDRHAMVSYKEGKYWLEDLKSQHGTYIGKDKVLHQEMAFGTHFKVGNTIFCLSPGHKLGNLLDEEDREITEDSVDNLEVLMLNFDDKQTSPQPKVPVPPEIDKQAFQSAYQKCDDTKSKKASKKKEESQLLLQKKSHLKIHLVYLSLFVVLLFAMSLMIHSPSEKEVPDDSGTRIVAPLNNSGTTSSPDNRNSGTTTSPDNRNSGTTTSPDNRNSGTIDSGKASTEQTDASSRITVTGKIVRLAEYENRIVYFVISIGKEEMAVGCLSPLPPECAMLVKNAHKSGVNVQIYGHERKLSSGVLLLTGGKRTNHYIHLKKILCGEDFYEFQ